MKPLEVEDKIPYFDYKDFHFGNPSLTHSQHLISLLKHRMAVQKALDMLEARIQNPPSLSELASFSGLSRTYFSSVFKEVMGKRLQDFLTQVRLDKAVELLGDLDLKVKQVAHKAGFSDPNYFCRAFKKKTGFNPTDWRLKKFLKDKNRKGVQNTI